MRLYGGVCLVCSALLGCVSQPSAVPPAQPAAASTLVRGDEGLNALANEICGQPCDTALEASASTVRFSASGMMHMELDTVACSVPGFLEEPATCSAVCVGESPVVTSVLIDMGPIGPNTRRSLCDALERDRGVPTRGSCEDVCESGMGCAWPQTAERGALEFVGHVELTCPLLASISADGDYDVFVDPNQSAGSNSISP